MKKIVTLCLFAALFCMFGFMQYDRGVKGDMYYSETRPNIRLKIDRSLRYLGETDYRKGRTGFHAYMWLTPGDGPWLTKMFIIEHEKISQERAWTKSSQLFRGIPAFAKGKVHVMNDDYQYAFYITEPKGDNFWSKYIKEKGFVLNRPMLTICLGKVSTRTSSTKFYYMKTYDSKKYFRHETLTEEDKALLEQTIEDYKKDIQYRGTYKK